MCLHQFELVLIHRVKELQIMATSPVKALVKNAGWQRVTSWNPQGVFTEDNKFFQTSNIEKIKIFGNCDTYLSRGLLNMSQKLLLFSRYSIKCILSLGRKIIDRIRKKAMNYQFPGFVRSGFLMPVAPPTTTTLQNNCAKQPTSVMKELVARYGKFSYKKPPDITSDEDSSSGEYESADEDVATEIPTPDELLTKAQSEYLPILRTMTKEAVRDFLSMAITRRKIVPLSELHLEIKKIMSDKGSISVLPEVQTNKKTKAKTITTTDEPKVHDIRTVVSLITDPKMILCMHYPKNNNVREYFDILLQTTHTVYQDCDREQHLSAFRKMNKYHYYSLFGETLSNVAAYLELSDFKERMGFTTEIVEKLDNIKTNNKREEQKVIAQYRKEAYGKPTAEYDQTLQLLVEQRAKDDPKALVTDARLKTMEGRKKPTYEESHIARLKRNAKLQGYHGNMDDYIAKNRNKLD